MRELQKVESFEILTSDLTPGALVDPIVLSEVMTQEGSTQTQDKENRDNLAVRSSSSASHQVLLNEERQQASKSFASLEATLKVSLNLTISIPSDVHVD